jgi:hypothetical protein
MDLVCNDCGHDVAKIMEVENLKDKGRISAECPECFNIVPFAHSGSLKAKALSETPEFLISSEIKRNTAERSRDTLKNNSPNSIEQWDQRWDFKDPAKISRCPECDEQVFGSSSCEWCGLQFGKEKELGRPADLKSPRHSKNVNLNSIGRFKRAWRELKENPESERFHYLFWSEVKDASLYMEGSKRLTELKKMYPENDEVLKLCNGTLRSIEVLINFQQFETEAQRNSRVESTKIYQRVNRALAWTLLAAAVSTIFMSLLFF